MDASRICIAGESGGGYICFGAMVMLAQKGETDLVKLAIPMIPMISDYSFGDLNQMTKEERENAYYVRRFVHVYFSRVNILANSAGGGRNKQISNKGCLLFSTKKRRIYREKVGEEIRNFVQNIYPRYFYPE